MTEHIGDFFFRLQKLQLLLKDESLDRIYCFQILRSNKQQTFVKYIWRSINPENYKRIKANSYIHILNYYHKYMELIMEPPFWIWIF